MSCCVKVTLRRSLQLFATLIFLTSPAYLYLYWQTTRHTDENGGGGGALKKLNASAAGTAARALRRQQFLAMENDLSVNTNSYESHYADYKRKQAAQQSWYRTRHVDKNVRVTQKNLRAHSGQLNKTSYLLIEYTQFFGAYRFCPHFNLHNSSDQRRNGTAPPFYLAQCPYKNCRITCDKARANDADAFIFHLGDMIQVADYAVRFAELHRRHADKLFLLLNDEANPVSASIDPIGFNWTVSYRMDAEVSDCSYGCAYERPERQNATAFADYLFAEFKRRRAGAAQAIWFVSNCDADLRMDFAARLGLHVSVRTLGQCARLVSYKQMIIGSLPLDSVIGHVYKLAMLMLESVLPANADADTDVDDDGAAQCVMRSSCEVEQMRASTFYLSFESKNCTSYITEKFWRILRLGLIPVVMQPARHFYDQIAPPNSFIHAGDFDFDAAQLGQHLRDVAADFALYAKYFAWRLSADSVFSGKQTDQRRMCDLCRRLNTESDGIHYESLSMWFNADCVVN